MLSPSKIRQLRVTNEYRSASVFLNHLNQMPAVSQPIPAVITCLLHMWSGYSSRIICILSADWRGSIRKFGLNTNQIATPKEAECPRGTSDPNVALPLVPVSCSSWRGELGLAKTRSAAPALTAVCSNLWRG